MLVATIVSPDRKTVLPLDFEPIVQSNVDTKDLAEPNSVKRLIVLLAAQYPKLRKRFVVLANALSANGPHVRQLTKCGIDFLIGVRQSGSPSLFDAFDARRGDPDAVTELETVDDAGVVRGCRFAQDLLLNARPHDVHVNFLKFWEVDK